MFNTTVFALPSSEVQEKSKLGILKIKKLYDKRIQELVSKKRQKFYYKVLNFFNLLTLNKQFICFLEKSCDKDYLNIIDKYAEEYAMLNHLYIHSTLGEAIIYMNDYEMCILDKEYD